jgi:5-oxoprolinase (ATP-hydrolysing)
MPVQCSILSERRSRQPYGLEGGEAGASGLNLVYVKDEYSEEKRVINLGAKGTIKLGQGDRIVINSPGGGGWGSAEEGGHELAGKKTQTKILAGGSVNAYKSRQETN